MSVALMHPSPLVHPQACVHESAALGEGVTVWQFASVIRGARLGAGCSVGAGAIVDGARLGARCRVGHAASLHPGLEAGDEVFFGPGAIVCNDPWPRVRAGDFDQDRLQSGFVCVRIGPRASLGARAVVLPGLRIGEGAMIAAGAVVDCDVPAFHLFKRTGVVVEIERRQVSRMREAAA